MLRDALDSWPEAFARIVSIHRTDAENKAAGAKSEIHVVGPPYRALDLGAPLVPGGTPDDRWAAVAAIAEPLNSLWVYDPSRPSMLCAYADPHGTGPHLHLQVHPATIMRADLHADTRA